MLRNIVLIIITFSTSTVLFATDLIEGKTYRVLDNVCLYRQIPTSKDAFNLRPTDRELSLIGAGALAPGNLDDLIAENLESIKALGLESDLNALSGEVRGDKSVYDELVAKYMEINEKLKSELEKLQAELIVEDSTDPAKIKTINEEIHKLRRVARILKSSALYIDPNIFRDTSCHAIGPYSRIRIIRNDSRHYVVGLVSIRKIHYYDPVQNTDVFAKSPGIVGTSYFIPKQIGTTTNPILPLSSITLQSESDQVSGPLIVPFKYRTDDDSLDVGDVTVGFYFGHRFETSRLDTTSFIPFVSAGLSSVSVDRIDPNDNNSSQDTNEAAFSAAIGVLISNWDEMNAGLVIGADWLGDNDWEHEGELWISISVGWKFEQ
jgi:hypothetical protein